MYLPFCQLFSVVRGRKTYRNYLSKPNMTILSSSPLEKRVEKQYNLHVEFFGGMLMAENGTKLILLKLYEILLQETDEEHPISRMELCRRLKEQGVPCHVRTISRDVALLNESGYEVMSFMQDHERLYYIPETEFSIPELKILIDAVQAASFVAITRSAEQMAWNNMGEELEYLADQLQNALDHHRELAELEQSLGLANDNLDALIASSSRWSESQFRQGKVPPSATASSVLSVLTPSTSRDRVKEKEWHVLRELTSQTSM